MVGMGQDIGMELREAAPGDAPAVIALWEAAGLTRPWNDPVQDFERALAAADAAILILRPGLELAAYSEVLR